MYIHRTRNIAARQTTTTRYISACTERTIRQTPLIQTYSLTNLYRYEFVRKINATTYGICMATAHQISSQIQENKRNEYTDAIYPKERDCRLPSKLFRTHAKTK